MLSSINHRLPLPLLTVTQTLYLLPDRLQGRPNYFWIGAHKEQLDIEPPEYLRVCERLARVGLVTEEQG